MPTTSDGMTGAAGFLLGQLDQWRKNRQPIVEVWNDNRDAFNREFSSQWWKLSELDDAKLRQINVGWIRQKIMFAVALIIDLALQENRIRYTLSPITKSFYKIGQAQNMAEVAGAVTQLKALLDEQLDDCGADREYALNVFDLAQLGETYTEGYMMPISRQGYEQATDQMGQPMGVWQPYELTRMAPGIRRVSPWNVIRDLETVSLQDGLGYYRLYYSSAAWLWKKLQSPPDAGYIASALKECVLIAKGKKPGQSQTASTTNTLTSESDANLPPLNRLVQYRANTEEYAVYRGRVPLEVAQEIEDRIKSESGQEIQTEQPSPTPAGANPLAGSPALPVTPPAGFQVVPWPSETENQSEGAEEVEVLAGLCQGRIVRWLRTHPRERNLWRAVWHDVPDELIPVSLAGNGKHVQAYLNGSLRSFINNKKFSSNVTGAFKAELFDDDGLALGEGKMARLSAACTDASKAVSFHNIPDVGPSLMEMMRFLLEIGDEEVQIPRLMQGLASPLQQGKQTATETMRRSEQSVKFIGMVIRNLDNGSVEPGVGWMYSVDMEDPDLAIMGANVLVQASGFSGYQDKLLRVARIQQFIQALGAIPEGRGWLEVSIPRVVSKLRELADVESDLMKTTEEKQAEADQAAAQAQAQAQAQAAASPEGQARAERARKAQAAAQILGLAPGGGEGQPAPAEAGVTA